MGHTKNNAVTFDYFFFKKKITYFISLFSVVSQDYVTETNNEYIILGNDALMKCEVPSFVSDLVQVHSWIDNENNEFYLKDGFRSKTGSSFLFLEGVRANLGMAKKVTICKKSTIFALFL